MSARLLLFIICMLSLAVVAPCQDFIMEGCFWSCPTKSDSMGVNFWKNKLIRQAPDLAFAGFTYLWMPTVPDSEHIAFSGLVKTIRSKGLESIIDVSAPKEGAIFQPIPQANKFQQDLQIKGFRVETKGEPDPIVIANFLNESQLKNNLPTLIYADISEWQSPPKLATWVNKVTQNLAEETRTNVTARVYDFVLREALRRACNDKKYDVRQLYTQSLRDATALTGFNVVTLVNGLKFKNQNGKIGDWDDPIDDPMLAYVYLLTNNQLGLPAVWYDDYFGNAGHLALKKKIDQLLKAHQRYIFNSTAVEYLNRSENDHESLYLSAEKGADATQTIVFQMDGTNTPAGVAAKGHRDIIVAINFSDATLKLIQEINMANVRIGDVFTDILGKSEQGPIIVADDTLHNIPNAIYLELPPKSYSVWVQGEAEEVTFAQLSLRAEPFDTYTELSWDVPANADTKGYEIQKAINGDYFEKIAWIDASDERASGASYLYVDEDRLPDDEVFYRVKSIHKNGDIELSSVESIKPMIREMSFEIVKGEQRGMQSIKVRSNYEDDALLAVYNAAGDLVKSNKQHIRKGVSTVKLDLSDLPKGVYWVHLSTNRKKNWSSRIVNL